MIALFGGTGRFFAVGRRGRQRIALTTRASLLRVFEGTGERVTPRWFGWAGVFTLFAATGLYGMVAGGHSARIFEQVSAGAGFAISTVQISGHAQLDEIEVLESLDLHPGTSLMTYNAEAALDRLRTNGWVSSASVRKVYPGTLKIALTERQPLGLWQRGSLVSLIDSDGFVITDDVNGRFAALPLFVGHGAQDRASGFLALLERFPAIRSRARAAVFVSNRRWDLVLDNDIEIKLPETGVEAALDELLRLDAESGLMTRDIVSVDLRLKDEIVVRLTEDGMVKRKATVKSRREGEKPETDT